MQANEANRFVHNYWLGGNAPMITVYSNRIEILSRGTLAPGQTLRGFYMGESVPVNRKLSDIFLQLHISGRSGRGIPKITQVYGREAITFSENSIIVTIPFEKSNMEAGDKNPQLNSTRRSLLKAMRNNPNITQTQLMAVIGIGRTAVQKNVSFLRKNGYLERVGSNKNGYWKVL